MKRPAWKELAQKPFKFIIFADCKRLSICGQKDLPMNAIIFDLDGVLCYTDEYHYMAWKAIADELHIPFNREVN